MKDGNPGGLPTCGIKAGDCDGESAKTEDFADQLRTDREALSGSTDQAAVFAQQPQHLEQLRQLIARTTQFDICQGGGRHEA